MTAKKATLKGHGNPTQIMYFGIGSKPKDKGILVSVESVRRGSYTLTDVERNVRVGWTEMSGANKFWGESI